MPAATDRVILLHYHLFKNAGTSVDAMLAANFGERWVEQEFPQPPRATNVEWVREHILANPHLAALSSHTALMPVPQIDGVEIFPIVFVRHPLLRIRSAYIFERKQQVDTGGSRLARAADFAGYLRALLAKRPPNQARNFQTARLAWFDPDESRPARARARDAIRSLPFVGLVEDYNRSISRLAALLKPRIPDFKPLVVRKNVTSEQGRSIGEQLAAIRDDIGPELYEELTSANADDLATHTEIAHRYARRAREEEEAHARARA